MHSHRRTGFSIIELVIFLAALVVLIAIAAPRLVRTLEREREPVTIEMVSAVPQVVYIGTSDTVAVRVIGRNGQPVQHRRVEFRSSAMLDSLAPARPHTDSSGIARAAWRVAGEPGERTLRLTVPGTQLDTSVITRAELRAEPAGPAAEQPETTIEGSLRGAEPGGVDPR